MSTLVAETCPAGMDVGLVAAPSSTTAPTSSPLTLREVRPEDGRAIHAMLVAGIPGTLADADRWLRRWRWQGLHNPFRGERAAGWVLEDAGAVVGHIGAVYLPLRIGEERRIGQVVADYVISPEATSRGGLFAGLRLAQAFVSAAEGLVPMATTANEKTGAVLGRYGCRPVSWTREMWRAPATQAQEILSCLGGPNRVWRRLLRSKTGATLCRAAGWCCRVSGVRPPLPLPSDCHLEILEAPGIRELEPLAAMGPGGDATCAIDLSADYLDWRYARHPEWNDIRVAVLRRSDGCPAGGVVVFCERIGKRRIAFVEELAFPPCHSPSSRGMVSDEPSSADAPMVRALLCSALRVAVDLDAHYLVTTTGGSATRSLFWELGFEDRARSAPALVLPEAIANSPAFQHGMMF